MMEAIKIFYFSLWASIINWNIFIRAAIVLAFVFVAAWLATKSLLPIAIWLLKKLIILIYLFINRLIFSLLIKSVSIESAWSGRFQKLSNYISEGFENVMIKLGETHLHSFIPNSKVYFAVAYILCMAVIMVPHVLGDYINHEYKGFIDKGNNFYLTVETFLAGDAREYEPFFISQGIDAAENQIKEEVWLSLAKEGRAGANLRQTAGINGKILKVIKGDEKLLFLNRFETANSVEWVNVATSDGVAGWISKKLVEGLPE